MTANRVRNHRLLVPTKAISFVVPQSVEKSTPTTLQHVRAVTVGASLIVILLALVSVSNPGNAGWVHLRQLAGSDAYVTYGYVGESTSDYVYLFTFVDSIPFMAGETKRFAIDRSGSAFPLSAGVHALRPFFNADTGAAVTYSVRQ